MHLSDHLISPILSHGCEVWGNYDWAEIERLHLWFCKSVLGVKTSTSTDGIYAELGRWPLRVYRQIQMIKFTTRISRLEGTRYAKKALKILIEDDMKGHCNWFSQVIDIMKSNNLREVNVSNNEIKLRLTENYKTSLLDRLKTLDTEKIEDLQQIQAHY